MFSDSSSDDGLSGLLPALQEGLEWLACGDASESDGIVAGATADGEPIRICRVNQDDECGVASIVSGAAEALLGFFGKCVPCPEYELLTTSVPVKWVPAEYGEIPNGAVPVGTDGSGKPIFVARVVVDGVCLPAKLMSAFHGAFCGWNDLEFFRRKYEVLVVCEEDDAVDVTEPPETDLTDTHDEDNLCDDRVDNVEVPDGLVWKYAVDGETFDDAVVSGENDEGQALHIVRGTERLELASGVLRIGEAMASIPYYGIGSKHDRYEVLVNEGGIPLKWVHAENGDVPDGAIPSGWNAKDEVMYVARCKINGVKIPGKLNVTMQRAYSADCGKEYTRQKYEVLCVAEEGEDYEEESEEEEEVEDCVNRDDIPETEGLSWEAMCDGEVPDNAVAVKGKGCRRYFIARACVGDELATGGVKKGQSAEIPYAQIVQNVAKYEVLVSDGEAPLYWVPSCGGEVPDGAVQSGSSEGGDAIYPARGKPDGKKFKPGKVRVGYETAFVADKGAEVALDEYEILVCSEDAAEVEDAKKAKIGFGDDDEDEE